MMSCFYLLIFIYRLAFVQSSGKSPNEIFDIDRDTFLRMLDDFNDLLGPKAMYILMDATGGRNETAAGLQIMKSQMRKRFVGNILVESSFQELQPNQAIHNKNGTTLIVSLTSTRSASLTVRNFCKEGLCKPPYIWLVPWSEVYSVHHLELVPESDFFLVQKNGSSIVLTEAYQTAHKSPTTFQKYGHWESGNLTLETTKDKYETRNLSGVTIRVVTTTAQPAVFVDDHNTLAGFHGQLWKAIAKTLQLNFTLVDVTDEYGSRDEYGNWTGMIGMLHRNEADIAVADFTPTKERYQVADFIMPFNTHKSCLYIKKPAAAMNWDTFMNPMSFDSWMMLTIAFVMISIIAVMFYSASEKGMQNLGWPVFITTSSLAQQGVTLEPSATSSRILFLSVFFTSLIINAMYNASLTSVLAVQESHLPYHDYKELYQFSNHKLAIVKGASYYEILKSGNAIEKKIYRERILPVQSVEEGLQKALDGNVAFLWTPPMVNHLVGGNCTHYKIPQCFFTAVEGWAVRKNFAYNGFIDHYFKKMKENGQLSRWKKKWDSTFQMDCNHSEMTRPLAIKDVFVAFIMLLAAFGITLLLIQFERLHAKCH